MNSPSLLALLRIYLQVDVDAPQAGTTPGQYYLAIALVAIIAAVVIALRYRSPFAGLEPAEKAHKAALTGSKRDQTPRTLRIPRGADPETYRDDVRALFDADVAVVQARVTTLDALGSIGGAFRESWRPLTTRFSAFVLRLVSLAWLVATFGALAVSTDAVVRLLLIDTEITSYQAAVDRVLELSMKVLEAGHELLVSFPYLGEIASLAFAFGTLGAEWLYRHYWVVALALVALAIAVWYFERRVDDELETKLYEQRRHLVAAWVGSFVLVWFAGAMPAGVGSYLGSPELGAQVGFGMAGAVALVLGVIGTARYAQRLRSTAHLARGESGPVTGYLVVRRLSLTAAIPAALLIVVYAAVLVATGRLADVLEALAAADVGVQAFVAGVVVLLVAGTGYLVRSAWPDVRSAVTESLSRTQLRAVFFWRGSLALGFAVGYLVAFAYSRDVVLALVVGPIGAVVAFALYGLLERAKYRVSLLDRERSVPRAVTVQGYRLRDADGDRHPFAVVNGKSEIAREDVDDLTDEVLAAVVCVQDGEGYGPSLGTWHAESLLDLGQPDEERTRERVREHARKLLVDELRPVGTVVDVDDVERACRDVPESSWRSWLSDLRGDVVLDHGEQIEMVRDPWT